MNIDISSEEEYKKQNDNSCERIDTWKTLMQEKFTIPDGYEFAVLYDENGSPDSLISHCEAMHCIILKDKNGQFFRCYEDGYMERMITMEKYIYNLNNPYKQDSAGNEMTQQESDIIAHFIQLVQVIQNSSWHKNKPILQYNMNGDGLARGDFPSLELTVFALLYIRQLIDDHDNMIKKAVNIFKKHSSNSEKQDFLKNKVREINDFLQEAPNQSITQNFATTNKELIEIFQYGTLILHGPQNIKKDELRKKVNEIYLHKDKLPFILFSLNDIILQILSKASKISYFIYRDVALWISENKIPAPDVMWQQSIFEWEPLVEKKEVNNEPPKFGVAYNVEIREEQQ